MGRWRQHTPPATCCSVPQIHLVFADPDESLHIGHGNLPSAATQSVDNNRSGRFVTGRCVVVVAIEEETGVDSTPAKALADEGPKQLARALRWSDGRDGEPLRQQPHSVPSFPGNGYVGNARPPATSRAARAECRRPPCCPGEP